MTTAWLRVFFPDLSHCFIKNVRPVSVERRLSREANRESGLVDDE